MPENSGKELLHKYEMRQLEQLHPARQSFWKDAPPGYVRSVQRSAGTKGISQPVHSILPHPSPFEAKKGMQLSYAVIDSRAENLNKERKEANRKNLDRAMGRGLDQVAVDPVKERRKMAAAVNQVVADVTKGHVRQVEYAPYW